MFTFVPDSTPVGVVTSHYNPAMKFQSGSALNAGDDTFLIGFGAFKLKAGGTIGEDDILAARSDGRPDGVSTTMTADGMERVIKSNGLQNTVNYRYASDALEEKTMGDWQMEWSKGGNWVNYFDYLQPGENDESRVQELAQDKLFDRLQEDKKKRR